MDTDTDNSVLQFILPRKGKFTIVSQGYDDTTIQDGVATYDKCDYQSKADLLKSLKSPNDACEDIYQRRLDTI